MNAKITELASSQYRCCLSRSASMRVIRDAAETVSEKAATQILQPQPTPA
jgi:hypothetical protein